jgi:hypothetical protein
MRTISLKSAGFLNKSKRVKIDGKMFYPSHFISANKKQLGTTYSDLELGRMFRRLQEATESVVINGITYYHIDLEDRGWGAKQLTQQT